MREHARWIGLLAAELGLLVWIAGLGDLRAHVPLYLLLFGAAALLHIGAALLAMRQHLPLRYVVIAACVLRAPMFFNGPSLSDDVWRYLHDGRAQIAGVNPYLYAPGDPRTANYRGPEFTRINHPQLPTIYPPVAQYFFRAASWFPAPLLAWRLLLFACELVLIFAAAHLLIPRGSSANLALYAWHPLAITEIIGSGHLEPVGIMLLVGAIGLAARPRPGLAAAALAGSVAAKLVAAPLVLLLPARRSVLPAFAATLLLLYLPFADAGSALLGSLGTFARTWESNGSIYALLGSMLGGENYRLVALLALVSAIMFMRMRATRLTDTATIYFLMLFALAPVVHPWYLLWILALLPLRAHPLDAVGIAALTWTVTVVLAYTAHHQQSLVGEWRIPGAVLLLEYLPVYGMLGYAIWQKPAIRKRVLRFQ
jgi:hypothetical protein